MQELKTHYEIISNKTTLTSKMAFAIKALYEKQTKQTFEVREVAE